MQQQQPPAPVPPPVPPAAAVRPRVRGGPGAGRMAHMLQPYDPAMPQQPIHIEVGPPGPVVEHGPDVPAAVRGVPLRFL
jgi:hypothetical protein